MKCDAVFEGGGVKGIAFIGAIQETERQGYHFQQLAGTSAGAMVASLLAAGYTGKELEELIDEMTFLSFLDLDWMGRIPFVGKGLNILLRNGIYSAKRIEQWMQEKLHKKGVRTFGDLADGKLSIIASDISNGRMMELPADLSQYGLDEKYFPVARAVRMSCTIPYFFQPTVLSKRRKKIYIVDGGLLSNYPLWIFDAPNEPRWPTFGYRLRGNEPKGMSRITGPFTMYLAIFSTMREAHDRRYISPKDAKRTIFIPAEEIKATDFNITEEQTRKLIRLGREEAKSFFEQWNFKQYVQRYRRSPLHVHYHAHSASANHRH